MSDAAHVSPVRYSPDIEVIPDDEAETIKGLGEQVKAIQDKTTADYGTAVRGIHAKGHAIVGGMLERARITFPAVGDLLRELCVNVADGQSHQSTDGHPPQGGGAAARRGRFGLDCASRRVAN